MAQFIHQAFQVVPNPSDTAKPFIGMGPGVLLNLGFNIPVEISNASVFRQPGVGEESFKSITVMAHFDTGASKTSIDLKLAQHLGLTPVGLSTQHTAAGLSRTPSYAIDLYFPNTQLKPFQNLQIGSCQLPFNVEASMEPKNFGLLLGRDIMSHWNIVWNGPASIVIVSD